MTEEEQREIDSLAWEEVRTDHIVQNKWIDFRCSAYRLPDGEVFEPFYTYSRRNYVVIVASDTEGKFLCVKQFRQGIRKVTTEFPAGGIEILDEGAEDSLVAAQRELLEETGYRSDEWKMLLSIPSNATIADNYAYIFSAKNCEAASKPSPDETEFLHIRKYTADEIEEMIYSGNFLQAMHVTAWLLAKNDR